MPHHPRLVVSGDYEGGLNPAACPLGGAFALYGRFLLHISVFDERDCPCRELDNCPVQIPSLLHPTSYQLGRVGCNSDSCMHNSGPHVSLYCIFIAFLLL